MVQHRLVPLWLDPGLVAVSSQNFEMRVNPGEKFMVVRLSETL